MSERDVQFADIDRGHLAEGEIRAGHPDLEGLCLALSDWSGELLLLQAGRGLAVVAPPLAHVRSRGDGSTCRPSLPGTGLVRRNRSQKWKSPPRQSRAGQEGGAFRCYWLMR